MLVSIFFFFSEKRTAQLKMTTALGLIRHLGWTHKNKQGRGSFCTDQVQLLTCPLSGCKYLVSWKCVPLCQQKKKAHI